MVESHSYPDLTTSEGVLRYLSPTPFAASKVVLLEGGVSNFTYRIKLKEPYSVVEPREYPGLIHTMVLKHAEPYVRNSTFPIAVERQEYEVLAFARVPEITLPSPGASLPTLYHEDRENRVLIISDCGEGSCNLKSLLLTAPPNVDISRTIGHSLGTFLARLHTASLTFDKNCQSPGIKLKHEFASNNQARAISAWVTYGRLVTTLATSPETQRARGVLHKPPLDLAPGGVLFTPPLDLAPGQLAVVASVAKEMQERINSSDEVLTMGDFWPGNLLVTLDPDCDTSDGVHVDIVDWELAKPGLAGLDIGQFLAEMLQMRTFCPSSKVSVDHIVSAFAEAYRNGTRNSGTNLMQVMQVAATHVGAHLIALTPRVPWGEMKLTRHVVMEGVEYIMRVVDQDEEWLRTSVVGGLVG